MLCVCCFSAAMLAPVFARRSGVWRARTHSAFQVRASSASTSSPVSMPRCSSATATLSIAWGGDENANLNRERGGDV